MQFPFRSSISPFIIGLFSLILFSGFLLLREGSYSGATNIGLLVLFFVYLYLSTDYSIDHDGRLIVKCGFLINERIDIKAIKKIKKTRTILAAPAFSFDRMQIYFGLYQSVVISPKDKDNFLQQLLFINPEIEIEM